MLRSKNVDELRRLLIRHVLIPQDAMHQTMLALRALQDQQQPSKPLLRSALAYPPIYTWAIALPRITTCCLYLRCLPGQVTRWITSAVLTFLIVETIAFFASSFFLCDPFGLGWNPASATCVQQRQWGRAVSPPNIVLDLTLLIVPLPTIRALELPRHKLAAVTSVLLMGFL